MTTTSQSSTPSKLTRYERGRIKLAEVDGQAGEDVVDRLGDLGRYVVEFTFGDIYSREKLTLREREIATIACLTVLGGREPQLRVHLQAGFHIGMTREEMQEVILQTIPFAGFPTAINAWNLLQQIANERPEETAKE